jgi:hypothetical protein
MKPHDDWVVLPHGDLEKHAENLYSVVGELPMPFGTTPRRMTVVKLAGERLAIYSAIALDEPRMTRIEALGAPAFLIVPTAIHRLDIKPWKLRYPDIVVVAPEGARDEIGEIVTIDATRCDFGDPRVRVDAIHGTGGRELAMLVTTDTGKTLVVADLIFNLPRMHGLAGLGLRVLGFGPGHPTIPRVVRKKLVHDDRALRVQLRAWADTAGLERILPAHGEPIENPRSALLELAAA